MRGSKTNILPISIDQNEIMDRFGRFGNIEVDLESDKEEFHTIFDNP